MIELETAYNPDIEAELDAIHNTSGEFESKFEQLSEKEQEFVSDVVKDMLYDARGIHISMKGSKFINTIQESISNCIIKSRKKQ